jgi:ribosomal protein L40E
LDYTTGIFPFFQFNSVPYPVSGTLTIPAAATAWTFTANYVLQYEVTLAHTGPGSISPTEGTSWYTVGNYTLTANPSAGYGVTWNTTGGCLVTANATTTTLIVSGSGTVTADFVDTTPPSVTIISPSNGTTASNGTVTISASYSDPVGIVTSSVALKVDGVVVSGAQINATAVVYTSTLQPGSHSVELMVNDTAGNTANVTWSFTVPQPSSIPWIYIIAAIVVVVVAFVAIFFFMRRRKPAAPKPPKASSVQIITEQKEVFADGRSSLDLTIQLLDAKGMPIATDVDREIILSVTDGRIPGSVVITKGSSSVKTTLTSSTKVGAVTISATLKELSGTQASVNFVEKKRYCMICGQRMTIDAKECPNCGNVPPSGADTKVCKNCGAVIPNVAKFCYECGASQPT